MAETPDETLAAIRRHWIEAKAEKDFGYWPHRSASADILFLLTRAASEPSASALERARQIYLKWMKDMALGDKLAPGEEQYLIPAYAAAITAAETAAIRQCVEKVRERAAYAKRQYENGKDAEVRAEWFGAYRQLDEAAAILALLETPAAGETR